MSRRTIAECVDRVEYLKSLESTPEVLREIGELEEWIVKRREYNRDRLRNWRANNTPALRDQAKRRRERQKIREKIDRRRSVLRHYEAKLKAGGFPDYYIPKIKAIHEELKVLLPQLNWEVSKPGTHTPVTKD